MLKVFRVKSLSSSDKSELVKLLTNAIENNASVGFVLPINLDEVIDYWEHVASQLDDLHIIFIASFNEKIVGSVQLCLCNKGNGKHRAEVVKLLVHSLYHGHKVSSLLMYKLEEYAFQHNLSLLTLDTQTGSKAEQIYLKWGCTKSGQVPNYALSPDGKLSSSTFFYKLLK